ncbi:MAG: MliC family protein [Hyphomonadaceae bacterium]|nr:MliC family protein [Hyphomonadaceae bacterium]GIK50033.1 MAG: hypothetical protein BroJett013_27300 [Alphaproteobacteria bacterium]
MRAAVLVLAAAVLAACQTPCPAPQRGATSAAYACDDGSELQVTFLGAPDEARVVQEGYVTVQLPALVSGSGFRYASGGMELRRRGDEVRWTRPGAAETVCTQQ